MNQPLSPMTLRPEVAVGDRPGAISDTRSAVSWGAIFAGAAGAAALSLVLVTLGAGLGLSSVSPWGGQGATAATIGVAAIVWLTFTQLAASGMGGYLAGRLRSKWVGVHGDESYFRDTAHGFLAWAVATLVSAALLASTIGSIVSSGASAGVAMAGTVASTAMTGAAAAAGANSQSDNTMGMGYVIDSLFRNDASVATSDDVTKGSDSSTSTLEVARIFANNVRAGAMPADDTRYVAQMIAQRTGLSQADAEKRVSDAFGKVQLKLKDAEAAAREAADKARKASTTAALWLVTSLFVGAFVASMAATFGGRQRDR